MSWAANGYIFRHFGAKTPHNPHMKPRRQVSGPMIEAGAGASIQPRQDPVRAAHIGFVFGEGGLQDRFFVLHALNLECDVDGQKQDSGDR